MLEFTHIRNLKTHVAQSQGEMIAGIYCSNHLNFKLIPHSSKQSHPQGVYIVLCNKHNFAQKGLAVLLYLFNTWWAWAVRVVQFWS